MNLFPLRVVVSDEFTNGNEVSIFYEENEADAEDEILPGDMVDINLYGISELYYDFLHILIEQSDNVGDPFATIPTRLRGNFIKSSEPR